MIHFKLLIMLFSVASSFNTFGHCKTSGGQMEPRLSGKGAGQFHKHSIHIAKSQIQVLRREENEKRNESERNSLYATHKTCRYANQ